MSPLLDTLDWGALRAAIAADRQAQHPPAPSCEPCRTCPLNRRCAVERVACRSFATWTDTGGMAHTPSNPQPTREIYLELFPGDTT